MLGNLGPVHCSSILGGLEQGLAELEGNHKVVLSVQDHNWHINHLNRVHFFQWVLKNQPEPSGLRQSQDRWWQVVLWRTNRTKASSSTANPSGGFAPSVGFYESTIHAIVWLFSTILGALSHLIEDIVEGRLEDKSTWSLVFLTKICHKVRGDGCAQAVTPHNHLDLKMT